ncbi:MAG: efflux RND transporter periplasmic adaptor subunit [Saprospiraceae bacterium]|nr:efflux RND transporter periplasmic adaptor subunit [Saprospiraceae bacterium]
MRKHTVRILSLVVGLIVLIAAVLLYRAGFFGGEQLPEPPPTAASPGSMGGQQTSVRVVRVQYETLRDNISVNGSTTATEEVLISAEVPGKISRILFREGAFVKKGALLVQLDDDELQAQRKRLLVQRELTQRIAERLKNLYDREGVSLQEYEIARAEADQVLAEIALIDVQISKRSVRAPFDGTLGLKMVSEGSFLSAGMPIVGLVSTNPIHLSFSVPERYSGVLQNGSKVQFRLDGSESLYSATVIAREPQIDPTTRTLRVKASAPNPNGRILPGAFAAVTVGLRDYDRTILIPTEAIVPEEGVQKVYLYRNGFAEVGTVETGIRKDAEIQILRGLEEGDTVITSGVLLIRPGAAVTIENMGN